MKKYVHLAAVALAALLALADTAYADVITTDSSSMVSGIAALDSENPSSSENAAAAGTAEGSAADQSAPAAEQSVPADNQSAPAAEQSVPADNQSVPAETEVSIPAQAPAEPTGSKTLMDENGFLSDLQSADQARAEEVSRYSGAEVAAMTNQEIAMMNAACCEQERNLYETYKDAAFNNKNLQYLCELYLKGLKNQFDAYYSWLQDSDTTAYNEMWNAGYNKRALALVEIVDTYGIDVPDIDAMRKTADSLNEKDEEEVSTDLSSEDVIRAQNDLNTLGFENPADGNFGSKTARLLRRFQVMYGYTPADGVLNRETLSRLDAEAAKVLPPQTEISTETEQ